MDKNNQLICPNCGTQAQEEDNFCRKCGSKVNFKKSAENKKTKNSVSSNMVYLFAGLIVLLIVVIIFLNQKTEKVADAPKQQNVQAPMGAMPMVDNQKIKELKKIVEDNPKDITSLIALANILHDAGMLNEAISYYKKYLAIKEKDADARVDMGICYFEMGDTESAMKEMEQSISFSPKHQKAHFNIAIINLKEGNLQKSNEYFKKCYELDPATPTGMQAKEILDQHKNLKSNNK